MPEHIDHAQRLAAECGIENLDLRTSNFATAADVNFLGFDYIVAHGVYSWVDESTRADVRRFIERHLKPGGLAYISYNALPGRAADLPFQRLVRAVGRALPGDSGSACNAAIEIVRQLSELNMPALVKSPMAKWLKHPMAGATAYLTHEFMVQDWEALSVTDVRADMRSIGLLPVGSAILIDHHDARVLGEVRRKALATIEDEDAREFARDFLFDRSFRADVFIRQGQRLNDRERNARLLATTFMLARPKSSVEYSKSTPLGKLDFDNDTTRRIVTALVSGPRSLADIVSTWAVSPHDVVNDALILSAAGILRPVEASRASVERLNRAICQRLEGAETILNLALPCGTALTPSDFLRLTDWGIELAGQDEWDGWQELLAGHGLGENLQRADDANT